MIDYLVIIFVVSVCGLWAATGSAWKGICYTVWAFAALAFWWALAIAVGLIHLNQ